MISISCAGDGEAPDDVKEEWRTLGPPYCSGSLENYDEDEEETIDVIEKTLYEEQAAEKAIKMEALWQKRLAGIDAKKDSKRAKVWNDKTSSQYNIRFPSNTPFLCFHKCIQTYIHYILTNKQTYIPHTYVRVRSNQGPRTWSCALLVPSGVIRHQSGTRNPVDGGPSYLPRRC